VGAMRMDQGIITLMTVGIVLTAAIAALWILYTVIWRAVRRGMNEFQRAQVHNPRSSRPAVAVVPDYPPREWV
jgi:hypothetical protein